MKNYQLIVIFLLTIVSFAATVPSVAATISKPSTTLPKNWEVDYEIEYPKTKSEHDLDGAGLIKYENLATFDEIIIRYERAPSTTYTSASLKEEAIDIFNGRNQKGLAVSENGTMAVASAQAGFAKSYSYAYDTYFLELVFVKGDYYINAYAIYNADNENEIFTILNSLNTETSLVSGSNLLIIIVIVAAIIGIIFIAVVVMQKKKNAPPPVQVIPETIPPPSPT